MSNDKTEQPIPADFMKWIDGEIDSNKRLIDDSERKGFVASVQYYEGCLSALCTAKEKHLHSLPPSPVGESGARWVKASERVPGGNQRVIMRFGGRSSTAWAGIVEIQLGKVIAPFNILPPETVEWLDESPNPSRAGEISPVFVEWLDQQAEKEDKLSREMVFGYSSKAPAYIAAKQKYLSIPPTPAPEVKEKDYPLETLELLNECYSGNWPGAIKRLVADTIANAKKWTEEKAPTEQAAFPDIIQRQKCTCTFGPNDVNPDCAWPNCFTSETEGEIPEEINNSIISESKTWAWSHSHAKNAKTITELEILAYQTGAIAMYRKIQEIKPFLNSYTLSGEDLKEMQRKIATLTRQRDGLRMALAELMADVRNMPKEMQRLISHEMVNASEAISRCSSPDTKHE